MNVAQLIEAQRLTGTPEQIADQLNAKTQVRYHTDLHGYAYIAQQFGVPLATKVDQVLAAAGLDWIRTLLASSGVDWSHDTTQQMIDQFLAAGALTTDEAAALKSIGRKPVSIYEQYFGDGATVTAEQVAHALTPPEPTGKMMMLSAVMQPDGCVVSGVVKLLAGTNEVGTAETFGLRADALASATPKQRQLVERIAQAISDYLA
jgi:hypothetical protein